MPDRNLRERALAWDGRIGATEARLRAMQSRVYQGAIRTAAADLVEPAEFVEFVQILSLETAGGRWMVFGQGDINIAAPGGQVGLRMGIGVFSSETGEQIFEAIDATPRLYRADHTEAFGISIPMTTIADVVLEEVSTVALMTADDLGHTYTVVDARLKLMPV